MMKFQDFFQVGMDRCISPIKDFLPGFPVINIGAGNKLISGTTSLDYPLWDADKDILPYADNSIGGIYALHFLEHIVNPVAMLLEFQRVLIHRGLVNIVVPYYTSQMNAHDLDHKHNFCEDTWKILFNTPYYDKNRIEWRFKVLFNVIAGIAERNIALFTQLGKI